MTSAISRHIFGGANRDEFSTTRASFRTEIDNPIGRLDDIQIVLHHQDGVSRFNETMQHLQEQLYVSKMQARGWLIQEVQRLPGTFLHEFLGQFNPLCFAS